MDEIQGTASARVDAARQSVFDFITDVSRLPEWNAAIEAVTDQPGPLAEGAEWTVKMHPQGLPRWGSISKVEELDRSRFRFRYQTRNADGKPVLHPVGLGTRRQRRRHRDRGDLARLSQDGRPQVLRRSHPQASASPRSPKITNRPRRRPAHCGFARGIINSLTLDMCGSDEQW